MNVVIAMANLATACTHLERIGAALNKVTGKDDDCVRDLLRAIRAGERKAADLQQTFHVGCRVELGALVSPDGLSVVMVFQIEGGGHLQIPLTPARAREVAATMLRLADAVEAPAGHA